ncbi:MCE family protein [Nocardia otitidiscaviarum]|uniref:MCE family protein n=1 Tax=Nocardia otitidiscaviarum TaxID=1823 RepID=A0A516NN01_9NOCA|nr:MlaD family protein [Nocardia otitidiscaviarum]MCP9625264.1 MlaD family protein [Nocardia otitidiscaviarum]QDP80283.1 MCE family protein [Nocardia otitidiscaviarum]
MKRFLGSPGFTTVVGVALVVLIAVVGYLVAFQPGKRMLSYCALMPDAIGLYPGNDVTMRGLPVGVVDTVHPHGDSVRVSFRVDAGHPLRGAVTATTVSDTVLADRELEVLGDNTSEQLWDADTCITETFTPKSISRTLEAFSTLADELTGHGDPAERERLRDSVIAFDRATDGMGERLNRVIRELATALRQPDAAIGHIGDLIDAFSSIARSIALNWGDIKLALTQAGEGFDFVNQMWDRTVQIVDSLLVILPWLNRMTLAYGQPVLRGLDALVPKLRLLSAHIGSLRQLLELIPALVGAFRDTLDPETGQVRITYAPPRVALPQQLADQVCGAVNAVAPGRCRDAEHGMATVDLVPLVLGLAGAR